MQGSKLDLRGPGNGFKVAIRSSRGVDSLPCFAQMPDLPTKRAGEHGGGASRSCLNSKVRTLEAD
eukprot:2068460-Alexandrium_andersonii.AAC.1